MAHQGFPYQDCTQRTRGGWAPPLPAVSSFPFPWPACSISFRGITRVAYRVYGCGPGSSTRTMAVYLYCRVMSRAARPNAMDPSYDAPARHRVPARDNGTRLGPHSHRTDLHEEAEQGRRVLKQDRADFAPYSEAENRTRSVSPDPKRYSRGGHSMAYEEPRGGEMPPAARGTAGRPVEIKLTKQEPPSMIPDPVRNQQGPQPERYDLHKWLCF